VTHEFAESERPFQGDPKRRKLMRPSIAQPIVFFALALGILASNGKSILASESAAQDNCLLVPSSCSLGISREVLLPTGEPIVRRKGYQVVTRPQNTEKARFGLYVCATEQGDEWELTDRLTGGVKTWMSSEEDTDRNLVGQLPSCAEARRGLPAPVVDSSL
jgi:hypothetical protein